MQTAKNSVITSIMPNGQHRELYIIRDGSSRGDIELKYTGATIRPYRDGFVAEYSHPIGESNPNDDYGSSD